MENSKKEKRVRFFDLQEEEPGITGERTTTSPPIDHFKGDNKLQGHIQNQFLGQMVREYDPQESEFATAVAAATFAIHSIEDDEEENRRKRMEEREKSKAREWIISCKAINGKEDRTGGSTSRVIRLFSGIVRDAGEAPISRQPNQDQRVVESLQPTRIPSRSTTMRLTNLADQRLRESSTRSDVVQTKAESWEASQLQKVNKRYEKMKSDILSWENAKKMKAKLHMDRKRVDSEERKLRNLQHYQNKVARIDMTAGKARRQIEEKRRKEEYEVKEKAKYKKTKRKNSTSCFCC